MSSTSSTSNVGAYLSTDNLLKFVPEPKTSSGLSFSDLFRKLTDPFSSAPSLLNIDPNFAALLNKQIEVQMQMQLVSVESNIEKSRHEIQMAPIRNIRVG